MGIKTQIDEQLKNGKNVNIIIAGITCSGKTTLANQIRQQYSNQYVVTVISQDDYFKDLADIPRIRQGYLTDSINAFHTEEFKKDIQTLLCKHMIVIPRYNIESNKRISKNRLVIRGKINIFEGLHTITLLGDLDESIKVFVDTDIEICLNRRIARDTSKYGIPEERIRQYWQECIMPMSRSFIFPQREKADIVINNKGGEFYDY